MRGSIAAAACCAAVGAQAFLLPPNVPDTLDLKIDSAPVARWVVATPCPACAFGRSTERTDDAEEEPQFWVQGSANDVLYEVEVAEDERSITLGDEVIYSVKDGVKAEAPFHVTQVPVVQGPPVFSERDVRVAVTDFTAKVQEDALMPEGDKLVTVTLKVLALEGQPMELGEVSMALLHTSEGKLVLLGVGSAVDEEDLMEDEMSPPTKHAHSGPPPPPSPPPEFEDGPDVDMGIPFPPPPPHPPHFHGGPPKFAPFGPHHGTPHMNKDCMVLPGPLCRLKNLLQSKIDAAMSGSPRFRGGHPACRKGPFGGHGPMMRPGDDRFPRLGSPHHGPPAHGPLGHPHHMRPHGPHGPGHHGHHLWRYQFLRAFAKGLVAVLIPIMAGVTVGMGVSLLGLVIGRIIGFLWVRLVRGGRRGYASVAIEEAGEEERHAEDLPRYEDAPAYEKVVVVEEKVDAKDSERP